MDAQRHWLYLAARSQQLLLRTRKLVIDSQLLAMKSADLRRMAALCRAQIRNQR